MLRRSQVCSALRGLRPLGLALRATAAQRWAKPAPGPLFLPNLLMTHLLNYAHRTHSQKAIARP